MILDIHTLAYFIAISFLVNSSIYFLITSKQILGISNQTKDVLVLIAVIMIAYDYSYTHNYISV